MIEIKDLKYASRTRMLLNGISLTVNDGDCIAFIGSSGSGKSRLLRCIIGLESYDGGSIDTHGARIGMVFQDFNLFENMTALENVMSGMIHIQKMNPEKAYEEAMELLRMVRMADKALSYPENLSGGQKQRVAIARTLSMHPDVILFDEPTSSLDPTMVGEVESVIRQIVHKGTTIIMVSHEMTFIKEVCSKVYYLRDGIIFEEGKAADIIDNPKRDETRRFINGLRLLEFDISSKTCDFLSMQTEVKKWSDRYGVSRELSGRFRAVLEEMLQLAIIQPEENADMKVTTEYNARDRVLTAYFIYSGDDNRADSDENMIPWALIGRNSSTAEYDTVDGDLKNRVTITIK